jgi:hypothetical protein
VGRFPFRRLQEGVTSKMKLRSWGFLGAFTVMLMVLAACGDDPLHPPFSIEDEINSNVPYDYIIVETGGVTRQFTGIVGASYRFIDVRAEQGFLILHMSNGDTNVFNLSTVSGIEIEDSVLRLRY